MNNELLAQHIEALLFASGRPYARIELARLLEVDEAQLEEGIRQIVRRQAGRGIVLVDDGTELELRTASEVTELLERVRIADYARDIGKAGLETLSALLYKGPLSRSEIDFIRGVQSTQILRTLTMRGLIRRVQNPRDPRSVLYEPTTELLATLGLTHGHDLPDYTDIVAKLRDLEEAYRTERGSTS